MPKQATASLSLYAQAEQYTWLLDWMDDHAEELEAAGGVLPDELQALLDELQDSIPNKIENIGLLVKSLEASAAVLKAEADRLAALRKSREGNADRLKRYLVAMMGAMRIPRVDGRLLNTRVQNNSNIKLEVVDETKARASGYYLQPLPPAPVFDRELFLAAEAGLELNKLEGGTEIVINGVRVSRGQHVRFT